MKYSIQKTLLLCLCILFSCSQTQEGGSDQVYGEPETPLILISIDGFFFRFSIVCGERMSANAKCDSSITIIVPFGDKFGVLSAETVATYPSF